MSFILSYIVFARHKSQLPMVQVTLLDSSFVATSTTLSTRCAPFLVVFITYSSFYDNSQDASTFSNYTKFLHFYCATPSLRRRHVNVPNSLIPYEVLNDGPWNVKPPFISRQRCGNVITAKADSRVELVLYLNGSCRWIYF